MMMAATPVVLPPCGGVLQVAFNTETGSMVGEGWVVISHKAKHKVSLQVDTVDLS